MLDELKENCLQKAKKKGDRRTGCLAVEYLDGIISLKCPKPHGPLQLHNDHNVFNVFCVVFLVSENNIGLIHK